MSVTSDKLSFTLWLESEYFMSEREYSKMSKKQRSDIRNEYDDYLKNNED